MYREYSEAVGRCEKEWIVLLVSSAGMLINDEVTAECYGRSVRLGGGISSNYERKKKQGVFALPSLAD